MDSTIAYLYPKMIYFDAVHFKKEGFQEGAQTCHNSDTIIGAVRHHFDV